MLADLSTSVLEGPRNDELTSGAINEKLEFEVISTSSRDFATTRRTTLSCTWTTEPRHLDGCTYLRSSSGAGVLTAMLRRFGSPRLRRWHGGTACQLPEHRTMLCLHHEERQRDGPRKGEHRRLERALETLCL